MSLRIITLRMHKLWAPKIMRKAAMVLILDLLTISPSHTNRVYHILGAVGEWGQSNHCLRPMCLLKQQFEVQWRMKLGCLCAWVGEDSTCGLWCSSVVVMHHGGCCDFLKIYQRIMKGEKAVTGRQAGGPVFQGLTCTGVGGAGP